MDTAARTQRENEDRVAEEYLSSLSDLNCNSKPLINMLTMLAEENIEYAPVIVKVVEQHMAKVPPDYKLPILYLIDSIVKNVKSTYVQLFSQCIVNIFCDVFEQVNEKTRERMYALRQTWVEVFSSQKLYSLDVRVKRLDQNWPITARPPSIHVNPDFLKTVNAAQAIPAEVGKILQDKTRELLELKKIKLELELEATKKHLEQEKQFSKVVEGVVPPVEALVAANALQTAAAAGLPPHALPPQLLPGMMPPNYIPPAPHPSPMNMRPGMYPNIKSFRPHLHPPMMNVHRQALPPSTMNSTLPNTGGVGGGGGMSSKPRVHPVNAAMVNVMRQRDPRLARQLQQTNQQNLQQQQQQQSEKHVNEMSKISAVSDKSLDKTKSERSSKSSRKSPSRTSSASNSSSSRSLGRSGKNSTRDKEKNRSKRSESKSSTTSSSSAGSNVSTERKKSSASNDKGNKSAGSSTSASCDKDAFEIAPLSIALKHKSLSPAASPNKLRDNNKRSASQKTHNHTRNKNKSRSPSPKNEHFHDIDLRQVAPMASVVPVSTSAGTTPEKKPKLELNNEDLTALGQVSAKNLDKNFKALIELPVTESRACNHMDVDLRPQFVAPAASVASTSSSHFDSIKYKLLPPVSKAATITIDLTTELSAHNTKATSSSPKVSFKIEKLVNKLEKPSENLTATANKLEQHHHGVDAKQLSGHVSKDKDEDDIKKRPSDAAMMKAEEPLAKKSKSTQLEELFGSPELFGSEDVDLRQLMPVMPVSCKPAEDKTPPPPRIKEDQPVNRSDNWDHFKGDSSKVSPKKSTLDDVRAKLAKTAKLSKLSKTAEKNNKELTHRLRLAELQNLNEDTQEANDDKIRTMISQAQELLESKSITKEQHTNLLQTVMSINEANKLKIAKRQESLNAAREAVLKKRIPKLNKTQTNANDQQTSSKSEGSPRYDDKPDSNDGQVASRGRSGNRDKRFPKVTKWSDRVAESAMNSNSTSSIMPAVRPWVRGMLNNRPFRGIGPQASMNLNMRPQWPQAQFPNGGAGVGNSGPLLHIRNIPPMPQQPQAPVIHKPCNSIDNPQKDLVRTIIIDGVAREIRIYDKLAIVFMEVDQPHEIGFQNGQRTICIDNKETIVLHFNEDYKPVTIDGETLHMRFGFPSRELYIDEHWYEIYFGGPPVTLPIRGKMHMLKAEGPPPQVNIGALRRDLVVGKINMIIDAQNVIPLFLDARTQIFHLGDTEHTIQFADNLLTVLLDGAPTRVEYGGLPKSFLLKGKKYFVRFSALPQGVVAGKVQIRDMLCVDPQLSAVMQQQSPMETDHLIDLTESLDAKVSEKDSISGIPTTTEATTTATAATATNSSAPTTNALSNINIDELFQKLVSSGILNGSNNILPTASKLNSIDGTSEEEETIKPIDLTKPESIRKRQSAIVNVLFAGMPCSMCGIRFPQTNKQTNKYSQHLNWHYRQKRRERDMSRKARSRKWYFELNDWVQYEEVEDEDERLSKNFFESQKHDLDTTDEASNPRSLQSPLPSCPAGPADVVMCDMCHEKFEQVYNHDSEEWQLPGAIRVDDKIYHPLCYEDYKTSLNPPKPAAAAAAEEEEEEHKNNEIITIDSTLIQIDDDNAVDIEIKADQGKEGGKSIKDEEEDDDVIVLPNEEPSVTEIVDDDEEDEQGGQVEPEKTAENVTANKGDAAILNEAPESDVEIEEPHIPFTDLDTYEEKEPTVDEDSTQMSFMNVKIKEEPKIDEDEDDGFEDVGTVLIAPEEISIQSSEGTQTHITGTAERPGSPASSVHNEDDLVEVQSTPSQDLNTSMDGNLDSGNEHNLSSVGPAPTMPMVSLINKIKINITKNTVSNNNTASNSNNSTSTSANSSSSATATGHSTAAIVSGSNEQAKGSSVAPSSNPIPTISTIPVLCSGGTTIPSIMSSGDNNTLVGNNSVSTISVIGTSYGGGCANTKATITTVASKTESIQSNQATPPAPVAVEEEIQYELKPALQKVTFKKKEKVVCGSETSGLCSIM